MNEEPKVTAALTEELSNVSLHVTGKLPAWLSGTLVRNGPVNISINGQHNAHWFDGLAMLHAFSFQEGKVEYSNKFLHTEAFKAVFEEKSLNYQGFAVDPCRFLFKNFFTWLWPHSPAIHNANINVAKLADHYVALTEIPLPVRFDKETLETLGVLDYQDELPKDKCWESAHPHYDAVRKETVNYLIEYGRKSYYVLYKIADGSTTRQILAKVPVENPSYMHSFALTKNYIVLTEFPFVVRPLDMALGFQPFIKNFKWQPERGTRFLVIDRASGKLVHEYLDKPFFAFHHANAFEQEGNLHLDIVCYKDAELISGIADHWRSSTNRNEDLYPSCLTRFTLSLGEGKLSSRRLFEHPSEFPRINPGYDSKPYQFLYLADVRDRTGQGNVRPLYKLDLNAERVWEWREADCYPGEPVFVPASTGTDEDEGVILTVVFDKGKNSSFLLVLDGQSFKEIARASINHAIPAGLHGQFFNEGVV